MLKRLILAIGSLSTLIIILLFVATTSSANDIYYDSSTPQKENVDDKVDIDKNSSSIDIQGKILDPEGTNFTAFSLSDLSSFANNSAFAVFKISKKDKPQHIFVIKFIYQPDSK